MAEKANYPQMPQGVPQVPPPYTPIDPPPAYTVGGPYVAGEGEEEFSKLLRGTQYPVMGTYPPMQPGGGYQAPPTVVLGAPTASGGPPTVVTVVKVGQWGPFPMQVVCSQCNARVMTETSLSPGLLTWLLSGALVFVGCWLGCCLIPCCIPECQDIEHRCPNCKAHLGTFRRL